MDIVSLIISLISGAVGGNVAGAAMKDKSLGTAGNSVAGILGGGIGGFILQMLGLAPAAAGGGLDLTQIISNIADGGAGGAVLLAIISMIKGNMSKAA